MPSPIVETVREIPLIIERDCYTGEEEDTGFPFDDDREDQEDHHFRSQIDDIAARHPEFAQHFGSFPFRSGRSTRTQIPEHFTHQRFADEPFGDRFERFGFPLDKPFSEEDHKPYYQKYPKYYPKQNSQEEIGEQSSSNQESQRKNVEIDSESVEQQEPDRGRRPKQNIQQSNTVDLGQPQDPVDDRNQRSMSAPPPNNRPRFVSSINIPVNQPREKTNVAHDNAHASASSQPQERVIPIHVEGRDEPVLPKKFASQNTSQPQTHPQQPQQCTDKFFTQRTPNFSQYFNRDQQFQNDWFPRGFHGKHPQTESTAANQGQRGQSPKPEPSQQSANTPKQAESQYMHPHMKEEREEPKPQEAPKSQVSGKLDPIDQIKSIQKDVSELMAQVDQFKGQPKDKYYLYLDEMLTRNLIKLDNIDTQGQENIRQARKEAIKCIEKCISILESKANANVKDESECEKPMESESTEPIVEQSENIDTKNTAGNIAQEEKTMEIESAESSKVEAMEVEPITTEKIEPAEMETTEPDITQQSDEGASEKLQLKASELTEVQKENSESELEHIEQDMLETAKSAAENIPSVNTEQTTLGESNNVALDTNTDEITQEDVRLGDSTKCESDTNENEKKEKKKIKKKAEKK